MTQAADSKAFTTRPMREYRWFDTAVAAAACYARMGGDLSRQPGGAEEHAAETWEVGRKAEEVKPVILTLTLSLVLALNPSPN